MSYYTDHRVLAGLKPKREGETIIVEDEDGLEHQLPSVYAVCPTCRGKGRHVNPSIDAHGLSREDFAADPDFAEDYFSGAHDVECYGCGGKRVVLVVDEERCPKHLLELYREAEREREQDARDEASARRFGY